MHEYENFKTMQPQFFKAEKKLESWVTPKTGLSKAGKDWLVTAMDPFNDEKNREIKGYPDVSIANSVVQCINQSMEISATSGGGPTPTAPWDAHIALMPVLSTQRLMYTTLRRDNCFQYNSAGGGFGSVPFGGLMANGVFTTGSPATWGLPAGSFSNLGTLSLPTEFQTGLNRVIAIGFEVHNTTAELTKQGAVTYYRQPEPERMNSFWQGVDTSSIASEVQEYNFTGTPMRFPPNTIAQAMTFPGSLQKLAKDGAYITGVFHSNQNPPQPTGFAQPIYYACSDEDKMVAENSVTDNISSVMMPFYGAAVPITRSGITYTKWSAPPGKIYPFHQCGAIFSGLSPTTTLRLNLKIYVEQFPSIANSSLVVLATPSARYDPMALEIYSKGLSRMPVGVPVRENGLGQWFSDLIAEIEPMVTPMLTMLHPAAGAVSKGVGVANSMYRQSQPQQKVIMQKPKQKKTKKKNSNLAAGNRGKKGNIQGPLRQ